MKSMVPRGCWMSRLLLSGIVLTGWVACEGGPRSQVADEPSGYRNVAGESMPDTRRHVPIPPQAGKEHRAVMLQHLETVQAIVAALAEEDFERAKGLTEVHQSFFALRQSWPTPQGESPRPSYRDLAKAHYESAEAMAQAIPTRDHRQILPKFNALLKTCVGCHLEYKVAEGQTPPPSMP